MKWFNEILTAAKSFLGMEHDATEQEVHQKLTSMKNIDHLRAQMESELRQSIELELAEGHGAEKHAAQQHALALESKLDAANAALDAMQSHVTQLKADAEALRARIIELENMPAANHTDGQPGTDPGAGHERPYQRTPIFLKAQKIKGTRTA